MLNLAEMILNKIREIWFLAKETPHTNLQLDFFVLLSKRPEIWFLIFLVSEKKLKNKIYTKNDLQKIRKSKAMEITLQNSHIFTAIKIAD